ncbi:MAG TPA: FIST N-terminal domain-containing protein [Phycisphaerales bacterium]|nr:FIST N-terminal domain-containing protein [Phycisphaerales bacterium]
MLKGVQTSFRLARFDSGRGWATPLPKELDSPSTLVLAFGGSALRDDPAPITQVAEGFPDSHVLGCSTSGEIHGAELHDKGLSVAAFRFSRAKVRSASAPVRSAEDSCRAGELLGEQLDAPDLAAVLVYSDGLSVNGTELASGINSVLRGRAVVTGGLAGDGTAFKRTWVVRNGEPRDGFIVAAGLYGESVRVGHGSMGGWDSFGPERLVTRSKGNVLHELDGKPALSLYKTYLGDRARGLPATGLLFPLALRSNPQDPKVLVRTLLAVDEKDQSMTFAGDIPQGSCAQLMRANIDRLISGAGSAASLTGALERKAPCLAVAVSCVGRRLVLGERTEEELEAVHDALPEGSGMIGFYSYGEISPYVSGSCDLHNQTMTLTTISEE